MFFEVCIILFELKVCIAILLNFHKLFEKVRKGLENFLYTHPLKPLNHTHKFIYVGGWCKINVTESDGLKFI